MRTLALRRKRVCFARWNAEGHFHRSDLDVTVTTKLVPDCQSQAPTPQRARSRSTQAWRLHKRGAGQNAKAARTRVPAWSVAWLGQWSVDAGAARAGPSDAWLRVELARAEVRDMAEKDGPDGCGKHGRLQGRCRWMQQSTTGTGERRSRRGPRE